MFNMIRRALRRKVAISNEEKQRIASERLAATLTPDPDYRNRRARSFPPERRKRFWDNVEKCRLK